MPHLEPSIHVTEDGSPTLQHAVSGETYHSQHGAVQEAMHVYIEAGAQWHLLESQKPSLRILEIGLGTGLNAVLTFETFKKTPCHYVALEPFPISKACLTGYIAQLTNAYPHISANILQTLHCTNGEIRIGQHMFIQHPTLLENFDCSHRFDVIYMDAFSPSSQPELWEPPMLQKLANLLVPGGHVVTYCAKGSVRRDFLAAGLEIERLPGPPGKREMLRARKPFLLFEGL